jgi:hypothetical protein
MAAPSCPVPPPAQPALEERVGLEPVPLQDGTGDAPSSPISPATLHLQAGGLEPDLLRGVAATTPLQVYSRQQHRARAPAPAIAEGSSLSPGVGSQLPKLDKVRKPMDKLLLLPVI